MIQCKLKHILSTWLTLQKSCNAKIYICLFYFLISVLTLASETGVSRFVALIVELSNLTHIIALGGLINKWTGARASSLAFLLGSDDHGCVILKLIEICQEKEV